MTTVLDMNSVLKAGRQATIDNLETRLLSLPSEIRSKIWKYAIGNQNVHFAVARTTLPRILSPLLPRAYPCILPQPEVELGQEARNSEATWYPQSCEHRHEECLKHFQNLHSYKFDSRTQTWTIPPERTLEDCFWKRQVNLLLVCSQMYEEMLPILYTTTNWIVSIRWLKEFMRDQVKSCTAMPHLKFLHRLELHILGAHRVFSGFKFDLSPLGQLQQLIVVVDIWEPHKPFDPLRLQTFMLSLPPQLKDWVQGFEQAFICSSPLKLVKVFPYIATAIRGWVAPWHPVHSGRELHECMSPRVEKYLEGRSAA